MASKEATDVLMAVLGRFYKRLTDSLSKEELQALSDRVKAETEFPADLGSEIRKAVFNFVCPDTGTLVTSNGFSAHGNINPQTGDIEAVLTVECAACKKEHTVTVISFPEMLSMPKLIDPPADES